MLLNPKTSIKRYKETDLFQKFSYRKFIYIWRSLYHFNKYDEMETINNFHMRKFIKISGKQSFNFRKFIN
jgi:hypothetical protein